MKQIFSKSPFNPLSLWPSLTWPFSSWPASNCLNAFAVFTMLFLTSCAYLPLPTTDTSKDDVTLVRSSFGELDNWEKDNHQNALAAFKISCENDLLKKSPNAGIGPKMPNGGHIAGFASDWREPCQSATIMIDGGEKITKEQAKVFFERWFEPWQVRAGSEKEGLFTGYFEPQLTGSRTKQRVYQTPLLERPDDLVMADLGAFRKDLKGRRIAGRVLDGRLNPYESRAEIDKGKLPPESFKPIVWIDDPIDAFFLHIQGSGKVVLEDESVVRVGYAGQNGHPYYAIGRELVKRGALKKDNVTLDSIQDWLRRNPGEIDSVLNTNASYIFFRELDTTGPLGAEGVVLTPGRSLAIDYTKLPYGAPIWVDTAPPTDDTPRLQRLMVAQDTGGAIRGVIRGDVFWGAGANAKMLAGAMKSEGKKWILLPKTVQ